jgi:hypothetical protein
MNGAALDIKGSDETALAGLIQVNFIFQGGAVAVSEVEVAGEDRLCSGGMNANFAVGHLTVGGVDVTHVRLVDARDNGNRGGAGGAPEALYVGKLVLGAGSTLDLNGLHLYCEQLLDNGGTVLGGDVIVMVPVTPPGSAWTSVPRACEGDAVTLCADGGSGGTVTWYAGGCGGTPAGAGQCIQIVAPAVTTTYYARVEGPCGDSPCVSTAVVVEACGACCNWSTYQCVEDVFANQCSGLDEEWFQGQTCAEIDCNPPDTGACCLWARGCLADLTQVLCENLGGIFGGLGSDCADDPPLCSRGACCVPDEGCVFTIEYDCLLRGGAFVGVGVTCDPNPCPGACCVGAEPAVCVPDQTEANCLSVGGEWSGPFVPCDPNPCLCDDGDGDRDGDVDLRDFALLQRCLTDVGTGLCECLDMNNDGVVNADDFLAFLVALDGTGPR